MTAGRSLIAELASETRELHTSADALDRLQEFHDRLAEIDVSGHLDRHDDVILLIYKSVTKGLLDRISSKDDLNQHSLADAIDQLLGSFKFAPSFVDNSRAQDLWYERMHRYAAAYRCLTSPTTTWEARVQGIDFIVDEKRHSAAEPTHRMQPSLDQALTNDILRGKILSWFQEGIAQALRHGSTGSGSSLCFVGRAPMERFPIDALTLMAPLIELFPSSTLLTYRPDEGVALVDANSAPLKPGGFTVLIGDATDSGRTFGSAARHLRNQNKQEVKTGFAIYDFAAGATQFLAEQGIELHTYMSRSEMADSLLEVYQHATSTLHIDSKLPDVYSQSVMSRKVTSSELAGVGDLLHEKGSGDRGTDIRSLREHGEAIVQELVSKLQSIEFRDPLNELIRNFETLPIPGLVGVAFATWKSAGNPIQLSVHPLIDRSALAEVQFRTAQKILDKLDDELHDGLEAQFTPHSCDFSLIDTKGEDIAMAFDQFRERLETEQRAFAMLAPEIMDDEQISTLTIATAA